ncbi:MAG: choice-of-anchor U domain-containing protein [Deltaproteobacteria bacterium]|nr:choice-of-anchor U domain-containing protein [Deltaproteobacteria bacterium]
MRSLRATLLSVVALLALASAPARAGTSASFRIQYEDLNAAGGSASSASFALTDCLGPEPEAPGKSASSSFLLYAGCAAAIPGALPADDADGDGVDNGVENGAPNNGDGNDDGIPDMTQGNVTSLPGAGRHAYITLEACADGACTTPCQAREVVALAESELPEQSPLTFPVGLLGFIIDCSSANIHILYYALDQFAPETVYEKYGPNPPGSLTSEFYELPGVTFGSEAVGSDPNVASASFTLTDGGIGDATTVDGMIVDPGGPALLIPQASPALSPAALALALIALLGIALLAMRRGRFGPSPDRPRT